MTFKEALDNFLGKTARKIYGDARPSNVQLTPRGISSLGQFEATMSDVKKRGYGGAGGRNNPVGDMNADLRDARSKGFENWRDYEKALTKPKPEVLSAKTQQGVKNIAKTINKTPSQVAKLSPEEIKRYVNNVVSIAGTVNPSFIERSTPEKAKKNAEYIRDFSTQMLEQAPAFGIDPKIILGIHMAESAWGGVRQGNNLGGFGIMGELGKKPTTNLNYKFIAPNMNGAVRQALRAYKKSGYAGITTPEGFAGPGKWNANGWVDDKGVVHGDPKWLGNLKSIMGTIYK